ncbi:MAG TPA: flagellar biosynthetic protein FliR [Solirubrobacteraceae bacterium]
MSKLLSQLAGGELTGFILVLARVTPLFLVAPLFSSAMLPARVRGIVAVAISLGLTSVALRGEHVPSSALPLIGLIAENLLTGLGFAFSFAVLFAAVESAAGFVDGLSGFSLGSMINPMSGAEGSGPFTSLYSVFGTLIFLVIGGDEWVLAGIAKTFKLVPLTSGPQINSLVGGAEQSFATVFTSAAEIVAPVMLALLVTDVAFGVVSRVVPQLNVFGVGFPMKIAVTLLLVSATLPFVAGWISDQLSSSVGAALTALHVA